MNQPFVSVLVPVYNRADLVLQALNSVLSQEYEKFEILIVDDGSDDGTPPVLEDFKSQASRLRPEIGVKIIRQSHSGMAGQARNRGVAEAEGEWLAFLDSDDLWLPEKLSRQVADILSHPGCRISHTREVWRRGEKVVSQKGQKHRRAGDIFTPALEKCIIGPSTVMMEAALYRETGGFHEALEIAEDYEYWLRITARYSVCYLEEPLTIKRAGDWDQLSEKYGQIEIFRIKGLEHVIKEGLIPDERLSEAAAVLSRKCRIYAAGCLKRGKIEEANRYQAKADRFYQPDMV
ncbi:MAG: glycosyltransferase family 2 protein [Spirochaetales bacterium]|nr:glycosyltransferase family 2 protein [Spirochaetales bacterium]